MVVIGGERVWFYVAQRSIIVALAPRAVVKGGQKKGGRGGENRKRKVVTTDARGKDERGNQP